MISALRWAVTDIDQSSCRSRELEDPRGIEPARAHLAERHDLLFAKGRNDARARSELRLQRLRLPGKKNDRSSLLQPEGVFLGHGQRRDVVQRGLDRKQNLQEFAAMA